VLVEGDASEAQEIIFEVVEVPGDGLCVEGRGGIAEGVVEIASSFDLEAREDGDDTAIDVDGGVGDQFAFTILRQELEERGVAQIFFEVGACIEIFGVDFRDRKSMAAEMFGEGKEGGVFFSNTVEDADSGGFAVGEADDAAARSAELA